MDVLPIQLLNVLCLESTEEDFQIEIKGNATPIKKGLTIFLILNLKKARNKLNI